MVVLVGESPVLVIKSLVLFSLDVHFMYSPCSFSELQKGQSAIPLEFRGHQEFSS